MDAGCQKIDENDPSSDAPFCYVKMKVQPIPGNGENSKGREAERLVAPLSVEDENRCGLRGRDRWRGEQFNFLS